MTTKPFTRKLLFWCAGALGVLLLAWLALREPVQMASVAPVTRGPLEQSFTEEGKTRIQQRYVIAAPLAQRIDKRQQQRRHQTDYAKDTRIDVHDSDA